ncbi:TRAP transporter small permease [Rhodobium gokarnense]|uniref:TRAP transporter small permease protein n=1 Tax=Rhodobium gokarnense TaxID=364296 RepID=A0ABT3HBB8_9HYPH|nr:TRAP transporter small permease [Rhodobium gokarnense]MCW2307680.1 TRAP-type C4-dicarboxylate transport system permease small subunit [Rhodobium gokarnense]
MPKRLGLKRLGHLFDVLAEAFQQAATAILVAILALNAANILYRLTMGTDIGPVLPWTMLLFVWMVFVGFFPLCHMGNDVAVEFLTNRMGPAGRKVIAVATDVLTFLLTGFLLLQVQRVIASQVGELPMVGLERYWLSVPLFISCGALMVDSVVQAALRLTGRKAERQA